MKVGTVREFRTEASVRKGITGLIREINFGDVRVQATTMTVAELVEHYRQRELASDNTWKSYSTKRGYESYLKIGSCHTGETANYRTSKRSK